MESDAFYFSALSPGPQCAFAEGMVVALPGQQALPVKVNSIPLQSPGLGTKTSPFPLFHRPGTEAQGVDDGLGLSLEPLSSMLSPALAPLPPLWQMARHLQS